MALWDLLTQGPDKGILVPDERWDDGDCARPGDSGWSLSKVLAYAAGRLFNYVGTPNWSAGA